MNNISSRHLFTVFFMVVSISLCAGLPVHADDTQASPPAASETPAAPSNSTPESCVESLHSALLNAMKLGDNVPCSERYTMLEPVLDQLFDFSLTSRLVLGRYWKKLTPEKQQEFVSAFKTMSIATYAERFSGFSNEKFKTVETRQIKKNRVVVKTILITSKGEEISLDYTCVLSDDQWRIVTVTAKGVNDLALKRSEYTSFLKDKSIDELISFLDEQAEKCREAQK